MQAAVTITSVEVRPVGHPEEQTPARFPEAHAAGKKLPQEQEAAPRTARNAETREASHVCSALSCQAQGPRKASPWGDFSLVILPVRGA